jgi:hypothetical protein
MIKTEATATTKTTTRAEVRDRATYGLTVAHVRAFLEQCDLALLDDSTPVEVVDRPQALGSVWHLVSMTSVRTVRALELLGKPSDLEP